MNHKAPKKDKSIGKPQKARRETGINYVFAPENQAVIGGYEGFGFFILVLQRCVFANTAEGVQRVVEEFALPEVGWS